MIVITGAAGFIGSSMVRHLNESGRQDLVLVDDFTPMPVETCHGAFDIFSCIDVETCLDEVKNFPNIPVETCHGASLHCEDTFLQGEKYTERVPRNLFFDWLSQNHSKVDFIIHLGAEIDTLPEDITCFYEYILEFSQRLWSFAAMNRIPLLFAASSVDNAWEQLVFLKGDEKSFDRERRSGCERYKQTFDMWVLKQRITPPLWAGFSMAEVYGSGEYKSGSDASSVMRILHQIHQNGNVVIPCLCTTETTVEEVFTDRVFVKDVVTVFTWLMNHLPASGFYQLATGYPRPLSAVAKTVFSVLRKEEKMEFSTIQELTDKISYKKIDLPLNSLNKVGYKKKFTPMEKGVRIFVRDFLKNNFLEKLSS